MLLAFPYAYFMVRIAGRRLRIAMLVATVLPLWVSYLVRVYSWRLILNPDGALNYFLNRLGLPDQNIAYTNSAMWLVFTYIWFPFMVLPVYAALERVPYSLIEASADLGGHGFTTLRRITLPLAVPGLAAGSIFTFSLTLGDYIVPGLIGTGTQFIGSIVYNNVGIAGDLPLAAAYALVPVAVMVAYLLLARRTGAFESL
jgi:putative spermidine/putrescine transport system permease protein